MSGLQPPTVASLPQGVSSTSPTWRCRRPPRVFTFSAAKAAAAAASTGKALPQMPAGMDGAKLTVTVGPAVGEIYRQPDGSRPGSDLSQAEPARS